MPEEKMHFKDYRSGMLTNGIERAAHRALLYSTVWTGRTWANP